MAGYPHEDDEDKVYYCRSCHSLYILKDERFLSDEWDGSYCAKCSSTDVGVCTMEEWLREEERIKRRKVSGR